MRCGVALLHHPDVRLRISTCYHELGGPEDRRLTHAPDLVVGMTAADYFAGADPVLRAALEHNPDRRGSESPRTGPGLVKNAATLGAGKAGR